MAGIGFELNKLFNRKSIVSYIGAYVSAALVFTGPMLLGILLLVFVRVLSEAGGAIRHEQDIVVVIITYNLIGSMILNNVFSTTITRYIADMMYTKKTNRIMPALHGGIVLQLGFAVLLWAPFMILSGIGPVYGVLGFILFCELIMVWTLISFISAVKDYVRIIVIFALGVLAAGLAGLVLVYFTNMEIIAAMLLSVYIGYGVMVFGYYDTLKRYFPESSGGLFGFAEYFFLNPQLSGIGLCLSIGMFSHFFVVWMSPYGSQIIGWFYSAPMYDVPALFAFISTLMTTINFSTTTEVYFYPAYRNYFNLLNTHGSLQAIELAERDMLTILRRELVYLIFKQFTVTLLVCTVGSAILIEASFGGFNATSRGLFRILCVGYGIFASANGILMILFYFATYTFALISTAFFAAGTLGFSLFFILSKAGISSFGFSIMAGGILMYVSALFFLWFHTRKLQYHIFSKQPLLAEVKHGRLYRSMKWLWSEKQNVVS